MQAALGWNSKNENLKKMPMLLWGEGWILKAPRFVVRCFCSWNGWVGFPWGSSSWKSHLRKKMAEDGLWEFRSFGWLGTLAELHVGSLALHQARVVVVVLGFWRRLQGREKKCFKKSWRAVNEGDEFGRHTFFLLEIDIHLLKNGGWSNTNKSTQGTQ